MGQTRLQKVTGRLMVASSYHPDPAVMARRTERIAALQREWAYWLKHPECPRCHSLDVELSASPIAYKAGTKDVAERICGICVKEVLAGRGGYAPVYTQVK